MMYLPNTHKASEKIAMMNFAIGTVIRDETQFIPLNCQIKTDDYLKRQKL